MIRTLQDHCIHQGVEVHMECTIITLLKDGDRIVGAFGYERERGRFKTFHAKAVILATGGLGRSYKSPAIAGNTQVMVMHWHTRRVQN
jgi:succinate dehydrogenase / fumarate reductase flavoprotein subunit